MPRNKMPEYTAWIYLRRKNKYNSSKIDPRWLKDFEIFLKDVGSRPAAGYQLLKKNPDLPHGPNNTFWIAPDQVRDYKWLEFRKKTG